MRGRLALAVAIILTAAAGVPSASALKVGAYAPAAADPAEPGAPPGQIGETVPDPEGGPPWAVRVTSTPDGTRCVMVGRTDGDAFGPVDEAGDVIDTGPSLSGSCAVPGVEPVQVAIARYPALAGGGARMVAFDVAEAEVTRIAVTHAGVTDSLVPGLYGTFLVVREGLPDGQPWNVTVTLADGTERSYIL